MRNVLQFQEVNELLHGYYKPVMNIMDEAIQDCNKLYSLFADNSPTIFKGRTKGSFINDRLKQRMQDFFYNDSNIRIVEYRGIFGVIVCEKIFIRFNKMDAHFSTAINKKTKQTQKFMRQAEINGFPAHVTLIWGGYNPDSSWSFINGYYLVCFNSGVEWHYDMGRDIASQQLALTLEIPVHIETTKKRVTPKKKPNEEQIKKTGTDNK